MRSRAGICQRHAVFALRLRRAVCQHLRPSLKKSRLLGGLSLRALISALNTCRFQRGRRRSFCRLSRAVCQHLRPSLKKSRLSGGSFVTRFNFLAQYSSVSTREASFLLPPAQSRLPTPALLPHKKAASRAAPSLRASISSLNTRRFQRGRRRFSCRFRRAVSQHLRPSLKKKPPLGRLLRYALQFPRSILVGFNAGGVVSPAAFAESSPNTFAPPP